VVVPGIQMPGIRKLEVQLLLLLLCWQQLSPVLAFEEQLQLRAYCFLLQVCGKSVADAQASGCLPGLPAFRELLCREPAFQEHWFRGAQCYPLLVCEIWAAHVAASAYHLAYRKLVRQLPAVPEPAPLPKYCYPLWVCGIPAVDAQA
jgi:hypothetical protein